MTCIDDVKKVLPIVRRSAADLTRHQTRKPRLMDRRRFLQSSLGATLVAPLLADMHDGSDSSTGSRLRHGQNRPVPHAQAGARRALAVAAVAAVGGRGCGSRDRDGVRRRMPDGHAVSRAHRSGARGAGTAGVRQTRAQPRPARDADQGSCDHATSPSRTPKRSSAPRRKRAARITRSAATPTI